MYLDPNDYRTAQLVDTLQTIANEQQILQIIQLTGAKLQKHEEQYCYVLPCECPLNATESAEEDITGFGESPYMAACDFVANYFNPKKPN